jgi:hypothetical protein
MFVWLISTAILFEMRSIFTKRIAWPNSDALQKKKKLEMSWKQLGRIAGQWWLHAWQLFGSLLLCLSGQVNESVSGQGIWPSFNFRAAYNPSTGKGNCTECFYRLTLDNKRSLNLTSKIAPIRSVGGGRHKFDFKQIAVWWPWMLTLTSSSLFMRRLYPFSQGIEDLCKVVSELYDVSVGSAAIEDSRGLKATLSVALQAAVWAESRSLAAPVQGKCHQRRMYRKMQNNTPRGFCC